MIPCSLFVERRYTTPTFLDLQEIRALGLTIHQGLISKSMQHKKEDIFMVANSEMKHQSKTMLEVIKCLVLDFVLYFVTA